MIKKFNEGDNVFNTQTEETGTIHKLYPELNIALVKVSGELQKVNIADLVKMVETEESPEETKKRGLLDRIKGRFV